MTTPVPIIGYSSLLKCNETGTAVAFVSPVSISPPFGELTTVDTSNMGQADRYKTFITGLIDPGMLSFEMLYIHDDYARLTTIRTNQLAGTGPYTWSVVVPTDGVATTTVAVKGWLTKAELTLETESVVKVKVEVKLTGSITVS